MIWREGQIERIAADTVEAAALIDSTLARRRIELEGAAAWGQYLDDERYSTAQWGLLGTAAAVATLGLRARPVEEMRHLREALPLIPASLADYDPRIAAKVEKGDFKNMVRLAFIAEALLPGESRISAANRPPIVSDILILARQDPFWHPTSALNDAPADGDPFTTAYLLYALRRYEDPPGEFRKFRAWLAGQLKARSAIRARPDLVGLIGLALVPDAEDPDQPASIDEAVKQCQEELERWNHREPAIILDRPLFHGFNLGKWTDYTFLHPEVVAAMFLLRTSNPRPTRRYVAEVTGELVENVKRRGYFEGQPSMAATVDQFWASKLFKEFQETYADSARRHILLPVLIATGRWRWLLVLVIVIVFIAAAILTSSPTLALAAVVGIMATAAIPTVVNWAGRES